MSLTAVQMKAIDRSKEQLVEAAEKVLENVKLGSFGHSQLRNLLAVASETDSPKVVVNFIRYQMGRDPGRDSWYQQLGDSTLGDRFIKDIDKKGGAVFKALDTVPGMEDPQAQQLARIELTRQFIGFASRYLKFLDLKSKRGGNR